MSVKVKGSLLVDYARLIRANKEIDWTQWLDAEEMEIVNNEVMTSAWYSYRVFRKLAWACFQGIACGDLELTATFGRFILQNQLSVYQNVRVPNDPVASIKNFARFWQNFFQGETMESVMTESGVNRITYKITAPVDEKAMDRVNSFTGNYLDSVAAFSYQIGGMLQELVEQAGGRSARFEVVSEGLTQHITVQWE